MTTLDSAAAAPEPAAVCLPTARRTLRRLCAIGLPAGAAGFGAADLLRRYVAGSAATAVDVAEAADRHPGAWSAAAVLAVLGSMALLSGVPIVSGLARARGRVLTTVGAGLTGGALLASIGHAVAFYANPALLTRGGASAGVITAVDEASESYPVLVMLVVLFAIGLTVGPLVLTIGLRRARLVPVWVPVAGAIFGLCGSLGGVPAGVVGLAAGLAVFGMIAQRAWHADADESR